MSHAAVRPAGKGERGVYSVSVCTYTLRASMNTRARETVSARARPGGRCSAQPRITQRITPAVRALARARGARRPGLLLPCACSSRRADLARPGAGGDRTLMSGDRDTRPTQGGARMLTTATVLLE